MKVDITNEDKILFPSDKITKGDLIQYYEAVAPRMIPHLKDRPISMKRYPDGIKKGGFVQKQVSDYFPSWVKTKGVKRQEKGSVKMVVCNDKDTLRYLANQACITPHIWQSTIKDLKHPNRIVFDLDPPGKNFSLAIEGAKFLREVLLDDFKLKSYVMTTGSKGLHVIVPIKPDHPFEKVRSFAKKVGMVLVDEEPDHYTLNPRKSGRKSKLFIDYLRNGYGQTSVAPYAVRALDGAPIAVPLSWDELTSRLTPQSFNLETVKKRLAKADPWKGMRMQSLPKLANAVK
ncbi:MAG: non-homologous end-joining DNA ligase [Chlamydiia bacterium]|nr:non-homologous end-joining DNA ligase [Chlamydiia bacterium]